MEIVELILKTRNLDETKRFYRDILGFTIHDESVHSISFTIGSSKLIFEVIDIGKNPKYHFAFNIPVHKMDEAIIWAAQRTNLISIGTTYIAEFERWKAKAIYFYDNNHNILEFICRADLNNSMDNPFSNELILNISEIGLVADQPLETAGEIIERIRTDYFEKGPKGADFVAVGDDNGLFVISNPHRKWYPTNDFAEKWNVKARVKVGENIYELDFN